MRYRRRFRGRRRRSGRVRALSKRLNRLNRIVKINSLIGGLERQDRILEYQFELAPDEIKFIPFWHQSYDYTKKSNNPDLVLHTDYDELKLGDNDGSHQELALAQKFEMVMLNNDVNTSLYSFAFVKIHYRDDDDFPRSLLDSGASQKDTTNNLKGVGIADGIYGLQNHEQTRKFIKKIYHGEIGVKQFKRISRKIRVTNHWRERPMVVGLLIENRSHTDTGVSDTASKMTFQIYQRMAVYRRENNITDSYQMDTLDEDAGSRQLN